MPKPMGYEEKLPSKYEKYSARNNMVDVVVVMETTLPDDLDPSQFHKGRFWNFDLIEGKRQSPQGEKFWSVVRHPQDDQNYAEQYGEVKSKIGCLVLYLGYYDTAYQRFTTEIKCIPWVFRGQIWDRIRSLGRAAEGHELAVTCLGDEQYQQNVQIDPMLDENKKVLQKMLSNPTAKQKIQAEMARAQKSFTEFMRPHTREEQIARVTGVKAHGNPTIGMGGAAQPDALGGAMGQAQQLGAQQATQTPPAQSQATADLDSLFANPSIEGGQAAPAADPLASLGGGGFDTPEASTLNPGVIDTSGSQVQPGEDDGPSDPEGLLNQFL